MDVMGVDCYNLCGTGSIGRTLATSSGGLNEHIPVIVVLNDQGGSVMDVSNDVTATLRAQDHGHPPVVCMGFDVYNMQNTGKIAKTLNAIRSDSDHVPVICFEPGIAKREGGADRFVKDKCTTLRANMGDNQPAVCYAIEGNVVDRISAKNGKGWCEDVSPTLNTQDKHAVCFPVESVGHDIRSTQFSRGGCSDTLTANDYKDPVIVAYQKSSEVLAFKERAGKPGGGKGILIGEDKSFTLATQMIDAVCYQNSTGAKE